MSVSAFVRSSLRRWGALGILTCALGLTARAEPNDEADPWPEDEDWSASTALDAAEQPPTAPAPPPAAPAAPAPVPVAPAPAPPATAAPNAPATPNAPAQADRAKQGKGAGPPASSHPQPQPPNAAPGPAAPPRAPSAPGESQRPAPAAPHPPGAQQQPPAQAPAPAASGSRAQAPAAETTAPVPAPPRAQPPTPRDPQHPATQSQGGWTPEPGAAPPQAVPLTPTVPLAAALATTAYDSAQVSPDPPRPEEVTRRQAEYLLQRFDLSGRTHPDVLMSGGTKAVPKGPTARLPTGLTWEHLSNMSPAQMRKRKAFPYTPLVHPLQEVGGMVFPPVQTGRVSGLERADVWFDLPETYTPEFPPPLYLTSRPDLGDVSQGQLITLENADLLFHDVLTPTQLHGLKLMLKKVPARHHNQSDQRSTAQPVPGVACMDCHVNGHTAAQFSLTPDMRPQSERFRVDTASLRGTFARSWFGYKRALPVLEQFIPSEVVSAYFEGDARLAELHGAHGFSQEEVAAMAQFIRLIDFPPAPKLDPNGNLDRRRASEAELRGERVFEQHCRDCHSGFYFTDNVAHDLRVERFYDHVGSTRHGIPGRAEGPIRTPSLRGIKDSPPYLHDGRLLTLEDAVEFFNLVLQAKLNRRQRADLVEYLRAL